MRDTKSYVLCSARCETNTALAFNLSKYEAAQNRTEDYCRRAQKRLENLFARDWWVFTYCLRICATMKLMLVRVIQPGIEFNVMRKVLRHTSKHCIRENNSKIGYGNACLGCWKEYNDREQDWLCRTVVIYRRRATGRASVCEREKERNVNIFKVYFCENTLKRWWKPGGEARRNVPLWYFIFNVNM